MGILDSELWMADIDRVIDAFPEFTRFDDATIMITGAAGLVCSSVVDVLMRRNLAHGGRTSIVLAGRWLEEMGTRFGPYLETQWVRFERYDASRIDNSFSEESDYIIHGASNAFPALIAKEPVETMLSNFVGLHALLEHAQQSGTKRTLYISSSEVYGRKSDDKPFTEDEFGYIDLLDPRNSYSVGKRAAETLCASYAQEFGTGVVIARPGHIYGPTASPSDNRVSSAWVHAAARGDEIVMKSDGAQVRSYCHCLDCASALLKILLDGEQAQAYNISNPHSIISIAELAEMLSSLASVNLRRDVPTQAEVKAFNPMSNSSLDSTKLEGLGWSGLFDAEVGLGHSVQVIRQGYASAQSRRVY